MWETKISKKCFGFLIRDLFIHDGCLNARRVYDYTVRQGMYDNPSEQFFLSSCMQKHSSEKIGSIIFLVWAPEAETRTRADAVLQYRWHW